MIAMPSLFSLRITLKSCSVSWVVRLEVGSSRIRILAEDISSARAMAAICWMATEYEPSGWVTSMSTSSSLRQLPGTLIQSPAQSMLPNFMGALPDHDIFGDRQVGTKIDFLVDRADAHRLGVLGRPDETSFPSIVIVPFSGCSTPVRTLIRVDLPAPFSPSRAWISPFLRVKSTSSRAFTPGKDLCECPSSSRSCYQTLP